MNRHNAHGEATNSEKLGDQDDVDGEILLVGEAKHKQRQTTDELRWNGTRLTDMYTVR